MPDPNPSNRERLLRLIDGGTEALKEMQAPEPIAKSSEPAIKAVEKKAEKTWAAARLAFAGLRSRIPALSGTELIRFGKWLVALVALIAGLHYGLEMMKTMKQSAKPDVSSESSAPSAVSTDESGVGLRLVGVDTSDTSPVALLEDTKTGKTYFARVNEKVKEARVKQIQKNKVTVSYHGKNVELR